MNTGPIPELSDINTDIPSASHNTGVNSTNAFVMPINDMTYENKT